MAHEEPTSSALQVEDKRLRAEQLDQASSGAAESALAPAGGRPRRRNGLTVCGSARTVRTRDLSRGCSCLLENQPFAECWDLAYLHVRIE